MDVENATEKTEILSAGEQLKKLGWGMLNAFWIAFIPIIQIVKFYKD